MLAIVDTNVIVSGLLGSVTCRRVILSFKEGRFKLAFSEVIFEELKFVLERRKFHLLIDTEERKGMISFIESRATFVRPKEKVNICRDIKDNKLLECALEARPDCVVSLDKDLLVLKSFRNIPILSPKDFLRQL